MAIYRASAQNRQQRYQNRLRHRQQLGLKVAHQASDLLKRDFNAQRVVLFGSMRSPNQVHERSDVDLAVWGLNPRDYFRAVGQLQGLHPEIAVDLVEVETAPSRLGEAIAATGIDL
ncbi:nucleotidyltransferase domain-containing protein [Synechococcales cyanobacterium C]|uniref:Nucleotidyltransferase domain-containing protein n=2 Tax=Petrachloros TaxID=2918834 RepID=A0A8K1ZWE7_9CYAN|nr:nucleotidyltransferase domain-containing protein [Petrachloros mirabilis]NCJ06389.1 nucleotidyltransferase domain-containing protein [Petrachloros mirabilis ULC683]